MPENPLEKIIEGGVIVAAISASLFLCGFLLYCSYFHYFGVSIQMVDPPPYLLIANGVPEFLASAIVVVIVKLLYNINWIKNKFSSISVYIAFALATVIVFQIWISQSVGAILASFRIEKNKYKIVELRFRDKKIPPEGVDTYRLIAYGKEKYIVYEFCDKGNPPDVFVFNEKDIKTFMASNDSNVNNRCP